MRLISLELERVGSSSFSSFLLYIPAQECQVRFCLTILARASILCLVQPSKALQQFANGLVAGQSKPMAGYLRDLLFGISTSHSVMLSEIGRALGEDTKLITTEIRLSRNLVNPNLKEESIQESYLKTVEPYVRDAVIALDISEIRKDYAQKQEYLCGVWDNSRKERVLGYWLLAVEAVSPDGLHFPLWLEAFSHTAPDFKSQTHSVGNAVRRVLPYVGKRCVWVLDRGFDGSYYIGMLEAADLTYCIRQVGKRTVIAEDGRTLSTANLAATIPKPHIGKWRYLRKGREYPTMFRFGSALITFPKDGRQRRLVIVQFPRYKKPMMLLTNSLTDTPAALLRIITAYLKRWGIEEGIRLVKQTFDLENVRALSFIGIRRLTFLACLAYGFLCLFARRAGKRALRGVLGTYSSFGQAPHFLYYRLAKALALAIMLRGP